MASESAKVLEKRWPTHARFNSYSLNSQEPMR